MTCKNRWNQLSVQPDTNPCLFSFCYIHSETSKQQATVSGCSVTNGGRFSTNERPPFGSVPEIRDVVVGVTAVTFGGVVGDSQMVKSREEDEQPDDDDRNGAVRMLKTKRKRRRFLQVCVCVCVCDSLFSHYSVLSLCVQQRHETLRSPHGNEMLEEV